MKPGKRIRIIKGFYKGKTGTVITKDMCGLVYQLNVDLGEYWVTAKFWPWELEKELKTKGNVIQAQKRFRS